MANLAPQLSQRPCCTTSRTRRVTTVEKKKRVGELCVCIAEYGVAYQKMQHLCAEALLNRTRKRPRPKNRHRDVENECIMMRESKGTGERSPVGIYLCRTAWTSSALYRLPVRGQQPGITEGRRPSGKWLAQIEQICSARIRRGMFKSLYSNFVSTCKSRYYGTTSENKTSNVSNVEYRLKTKETYTWKAGHFRRTLINLLTDHFHR